jgi:hypothetical protein
MPKRDDHRRLGVRPRVHGVHGNAQDGRGLPILRYSAGTVLSDTALSELLRIAMHCYSVFRESSSCLTTLLSRAV